MRTSTLIFLPVMALIAVIGLGLPAQAEDDEAAATTLEERVERLERENAALRERLEKLEGMLRHRGPRHEQRDGPEARGPRAPRPRRAHEMRDRPGRGEARGGRGPMARGRGGMEGRGPGELGARLERIEHMLHRLLRHVGGNEGPEGAPPRGERRPPAPPRPPMPPEGDDAGK
ncbi:MAG: hypothetical protein QNJ98_01510 [Planctomycetota bacterium]|nr:hypothetical protein [Planctomycetota bacterium]